MVLLLLFLSLVPVPIFTLYAVVVIEGVVIIHWALSRIQTSESGSSLNSEITDSAGFLYFGANRAETLEMYVKSAVKRRSGYFRQHSRKEISRVVRHVLEESPLKNYLDPEKPRVASTQSLELDLILHPPEERAIKKADGKEISKESIEKSRLNYGTSLVNVLSEIESAK